MKTPIKILINKMVAEWIKKHKILMQNRQTNMIVEKKSEKCDEI